MKFYSSVRLDVRKLETLRSGSDIIGTRTRVKVVKNKIAPPFKEAEFDIIYGEGISREGCILDMAADRDIIDKSGSWYAYKDQRIGQGRDNARQFLKDNPEIRDEIESLVRETINPARSITEEKETADEKDILGLDG